jgi:hypothetical protein
MISAIAFALKRSWSAFSLDECYLSVFRTHTTNPKADKPNMGAGTTTCPGTGGCSAINTNGRIIESFEDGPA